MIQTRGGHWNELLGATIESVAQSLKGETRVSIRQRTTTQTAIVSRTRAFRSSLHDTPSGSIDRINCWRFGGYTLKGCAFN